MSKENGIACEAGKYENFNGVIMWGKTEGVVENACFKLEVSNGFKFVTFHSGVWENGVWDNGYWQDGSWKNGVWENGIWKNGTWKDGTWMYGAWELGTWGGGIWKDGVWERGIDSGGKLHLDSPNRWRRR